MSEKRDLLMLLFDVPVKTSKQKKEYRDFMKHIKKEGYARLQNSVYIKICSSNTPVDGECTKLRVVAPKDSEIQLLPMTVCGFERIRTVCGYGFDLNTVSSNLIVI